MARGHNYNLDVSARIRLWETERNYVDYEGK